MNRINKNKILFLNIAYPWIIAMFFIVDRSLKKLALKQGLFANKIIIANWLNFRLYFNENIAFSLPVSGPILTLFICLIILALFFYIIHLIVYKSSEKQNIYLLIFILFGALSNLIDRLWYTAVIDYLDLRFFTIFNLADIMISGSVIILFISHLRKKN